MTNRVNNGTYTACRVRRFQRHESENRLYESSRVEALVEQGTEGVCREGLTSMLC